MSRLSLVPVLIAVASLASAAFAQGQPEGVRWNQPSQRRIPGCEHHAFRSPSMDVEVGYNVYTPPGYVRGADRYPVIYFLHGAGGSENSDAGAFSGLLGRMITDRKIPPVICVFPNGGMSGYRDRPEDKVMGETLIVKELVPLIDRTYRTQANREGRVLTGFSMGGGGAVRLALKYPDRFSSAASWAGALIPRRGGMPPELEAAHLRELAGKVRLLLIVGDKDLTFRSHEPVIKNLVETRYPHQYKVLEGVPHDLGIYYEKTADELVLFLASGFKAGS